MEDFQTLKQVESLLARGHGFKTRALKMLQNAGMRRIPSFLWRSPLFDAVYLVSGADRLHQDYLGPAKKLQRFTCGVLAGSEAKTEQLNLWMTRFREGGIAGLISDTKLMTMAQMQVISCVIKLF
jgi:hypothetical protein